MNKKISFSIWYIILAIWAVILVHDFITAAQKIEELPYSEFKTLVAAGKVAEVAVSSQTLTGKLKPEGNPRKRSCFRRSVLKIRISCGSSRSTG
jgi:cell division protease FtsH